MVNKLKYSLYSSLSRMRFCFCHFTFAWVGLALASTSSAVEPTGVWRGEWRSGSTGHHGPMRVRIQPNADGTYHARFVGRFALVVPFTYQTTLQPNYDGWGTPTLTAEKPLGPILGSYRMQATVGEQTLQGSFQAAGDNGTIRMNRLR